MLDGAPGLITGDEVGDVVLRVPQLSVEVFLFSESKGTPDNIFTEFFKENIRSVDQLISRSVDQ